MAINLGCKTKSLEGVLFKTQQNTPTFISGGMNVEKFYENTCFSVRNVI